MTEPVEPGLDLDFIEHGRADRARRARRRRLVAYGVSLTITLTWLAYVTAAGQWSRVGDQWVSAVTMIFGSFVAGSTPQGGGAVAFPVFTKLVEIPAEVARTFSLSIQAVGMGAAAAAIVINQRRVEWRAVALATPVALAAFLAAIFLLGDGGKPFRPPIIPAPYIRVSFTLLVGAMALTTFLGSRVRIRRVSETLPPMNGRTYSALVVLAAIGGLAAALTGSGADVLVYLYLAVLLAVEPRVGVLSSVVVMAAISVAGLVVLGILDGQLAVTLGAGGSVAEVGGRAVADAAAGSAVVPTFGAGLPLDAAKADLFGLWLAAVPVVCWGAPLGAWVASRVRTRQLVVFVALLAALEIASTIAFVDDLRSDPALIAYAVGGAVVLVAGLVWMARHRLSFFGVPGVDLDAALSRKHLDVAEDYREHLEEDETS